MAGNPGSSRRGSKTTPAQPGCFFCSQPLRGMYEFVYRLSDMQILFHLMPLVLAVSYVGMVLGLLYYADVPSSPVFGRRWSYVLVFGIAAAVFLGHFLGSENLVSSAEDARSRGGVSGRRLGRASPCRPGVQDSFVRMNDDLLWDEARIVQTMAGLVTRIIAGLQLPASNLGSTTIIDVTMWRDRNVRTLVNAHWLEHSMTRMVTGDRMNSADYAAMMSVRDHRYSVRLLDPEVAKSLCRALDRVLLCLAVMQSPTSSEDLDESMVCAQPEANSVAVLVTVARCLVEVLKQQPHVMAHTLRMPGTLHAAYGA